MYKYTQNVLGNGDSMSIMVLLLNSVLLWSYLFDRLTKSSGGMHNVAPLQVHVNNKLIINSIEICIFMKSFNFNVDNRFNSIGDVLICGMIIDVFFL